MKHTLLHARIVTDRAQHLHLPAQHRVSPNTCTTAQHTYIYNLLRVYMLVGERPRLQHWLSPFWYSLCGVCPLRQMISFCCRLDMLERLCITWHGWVSAAVYLPVSTARSAPLLHLSVAKLDRLHASVQIAGKSADSHNMIADSFHTGQMLLIFDHGTTVVHNSLTCCCKAFLAVQHYHETNP